MSARNTRRFSSAQLHSRYDRTASTMQINAQKNVIGAQEWCCLPDLDITAIKARIDSGAKISSIHAVKIETFSRSSAPWVRFNLHPLQKSTRATIACEAPVADRRIIKSSNGASEERIIINTPLTLQGQTWNIDLSLSNREGMNFRMLLGREAMIGRLLVDCQAKFLSGTITNKQLDLLYGATDQTQA